METIIAYEGKSFTVTLQSMLGSTLYGWCLKSMPEGVVLTGTDIQPLTTGMQIKPVNQLFNFAVSEVKEQFEVELEFILCSLINVKEVADSVKIKVSLVPADEAQDKFVEYSENGATYNSIIPYGVFNSECNEKYGYPCGANDAAMKYGYPCGVQSAMAYGINWTCK